MNMLFAFCWGQFGGAALYIPSSRITCMFTVNFTKCYQIIFQRSSTSLRYHQQPMRVLFPTFAVCCIFQIFSWWGVQCFCTYLLYALKNTPSSAWVFLHVKGGGIPRALYLWEINETTHADLGVHHQAQSILSQILYSNHHHHHHTTTIIAIWKDS